MSYCIKRSPNKNGTDKKALVDMSSSDEDDNASDDNVKHSMDDRRKEIRKRKHYVCNAKKSKLVGLTRYYQKSKM